MSTRHHTRQNHTGPVIAERHGSTVIDCRVCGFKHTQPLPDQAEMQRLYVNEFYDEKHPDYIESQQRDLPWRRLEFAAKYDLCEELLGKERRRLLDVGSGPGWFLQYGIERGWEARGVEPSLTAAEFSRAELGLSVVTGFFEPTVVAQLGLFDVVHLNNVLEHVRDPKAVLDLACSLLRPSGLVCVSVPNDFNPLQEILVKLRGHEQWWVTPQEHVNYFDHQSLGRLLERAGFAVRSQVGSFPLELFAMMGEDYLADPQLGSVIHGRRKALELAMEEAGRLDLLWEVYGKLGELGLGRILTLVGEKS